LNALQTSALPSVQASEDEVEVESEEEDEPESDEDQLDENGDVDMTPAAADAPLTPLQKAREAKKVQRAIARQAKLDKKVAQQGRLAARKAGQDTKKVSLQCSCGLTLMRLAGGRLDQALLLLAGSNRPLFSLLQLKGESSTSISRVLIQLLYLQKERDPNFATMLEEAENQVKARKGKAAQAASSRRRKSEKEEDAELLKEEEHEVEDEDDSAFVFTESPACRWRRL
jgi:hypothetical protein